MKSKKQARLKPSDRYAIPSQDMPAQDPSARSKNVNEVATGYTEIQARLEAMRCLQCKNAPCIEGCPVRIKINDFVTAIADGDYKKALAIIKENSLLPAVCGRVCPQEVQCQEKCTVGKKFKDVNKAVSIGRLERFVADLNTSEQQCSGSSFSIQVRKLRSSAQAPAALWPPLIQEEQVTMLPFLRRFISPAA